MGKTETSRKSSSAVGGAKSKKAKASSVSTSPTYNADSLQQPEQEHQAAMSDQIHVGGGKYISRAEAEMQVELYKVVSKFMNRGDTSNRAGRDVMQGIDNILVKYGQKPPKESTKEDGAPAGPSGTKDVDTEKTTAEADRSDADSTTGKTSYP